MSDVLDRWPVWAGFLALFLVACGRGGATYVLGRGLRAGGEHSRWAAHLDRPALQRAQGWVARWGAPVVALAFLTVGVQTAVNAAAGVLRMPLRRYLPGLLVGALLWASIYLPVGLAVVEAVAGALPWWVPLVVLVVVVAVAVTARRVVRRPVDRG